MSSQKRYLILGLILTGTANITFLISSSRTDEGPVLKDCLGSPEEAFGRASSVIKDYISSMDYGRIQIDSRYSASLHSKSKLWTIRGYALCPNDNRSSYRWTVILNYHDMQEWEVLAKIVTPEFTDADGNQVSGPSQVQGKLFQTDGHESRQETESK